MATEEELIAQAKAALELMAWMHYVRHCEMDFLTRGSYTYMGVGTAKPAPTFSGGDDDSNAA